jgi:murein L,D-transpeptidase YcbB/YkuD
MKLYSLTILLTLICSACSLFNKTEFDHISPEQDLIFKDRKSDYRIIVCDEYTDTIFQKNDVLKLQKSLLECIADKIYFDQDYNASDMIFILENTHMSKWKFLFPEQNKFRGEQLFLFFMEHASNYESNVPVDSHHSLESDTRRSPKSMVYLRFAQSMVQSYNNINRFSNYYTWYENSDENIKADAMEWILRVSELSYEERSLEEAEYYYKVMLHALNSNHIKLKNHGEL